MINKIRFWSQFWRLKLRPQIVLFIRYVSDIGNCHSYSHIKKLSSVRKSCGAWNELKFQDMIIYIRRNPILWISVGTSGGEGEGVGELWSQSAFTPITADSLPCVTDAEPVWQNSTNTVAEFGNERESIYLVSQIYSVPRNQYWWEWEYTLLQAIQIWTLSRKRRSKTPIQVSL